MAEAPHPYPHGQPLSNRILKTWTQYVYRRSQKHRHSEKSEATRKQRESHIRIFARELHSLGSMPKPKNLKPRHIDSVIRCWVDKGLGRPTIENRLATLRWLSRELGKPAIVARTNDAYPLPPRQTPRYPDRSRQLGPDVLRQVRDPYVQHSLRLQAEFGLRRKEALMFRPHLADRGDHIHLEPTWTKGGKPRDVPIVTPSQRQALDDAKRFITEYVLRDRPGTSPDGYSLIPPHKQFHQQRETYKAETRRVGLTALHGLRHHYAQWRYRMLTRERDPSGEGWEAPVMEGPSRQEMEDWQKAFDTAIRIQISHEMGHARIAITYVYLAK